MLVNAYGSHRSGKPLEPLQITTSEIKRATDQINDSYERMLKSDIKYRFVIDNATLAG